MEMINVKVDEINGVLVTTSNRVAEELGVLHKDLLGKIDDYLRKFNSAELSAQFYIPCFYKSKNGRKVRNYLITKKGIAQLIGGYSSAVERAFELNVAYINKFDEMEKMIYSVRQLPIEYPVIKNITENYFKTNNRVEYKEERDALGRTYEDRIKSTKRMVAMIDERINDKLKEIEHISKEINNYREHISFYMSQI